MLPPGRAALIAGCLLVLTLPPPRQASAQVRRCTAADGTSIFTDRKCADIGATERLPGAASAGNTGGLRLYRRGCAGNLQDLVYEMTTAIDARDANRLAGVYHWVGISSSGATSVMGQLEAVVRRPLVDIVPVARSTGNEEQDAYYPSTIPRRSPPIALRVEQTLANGSTPSRTVFGLQRHFNCWWIRL
jgi:hypothetical protein